MTMLRVRGLPQTLARYDAEDLNMLLRLIHMNARDRFLGSRLGFIWALAQPTLMLIIFTFVFGFVYKAKLPGAETSLSYIIWLISGFGPWLTISESISSSTMSLIAGIPLIKNLRFKAEILPISSVIISHIPLLISILFLAFLLFFDGRTVNWAWLMMPLILCLQLIFLAGLGMLLSALNIFIRDIAFAIPSFLLMAMFLSPIFYPIDAMPDPIATISYFNPIYIFAEGYRRPIVYGEFLPIWMLFYLVVISNLMFLVGLTFFVRLRPYFDARF